MRENITSGAEMRPTQLLQGQVALITGASRGIGAATARLFARHGAAVAVNYHANAERAREVVASIEAEGGRALAVQASVDNPAQLLEMVKVVEQQLGSIDTLVMNATAVPDNSALFGSFLESNWDVYQDVVLGELVGIYHPARVLAPLMIERKRGNLIAVSSLIARRTPPGSGAHAAGKASVEALMKVLAGELGPHGIRANVVAPGLTETEASTEVTPERLQQVGATLPLRRIGQPEDIAGAILLLATDQASYLTGNYLAVGGGSYLP
ncbi:beta-ketoacyl-ACP reductase [Dictyobacter alpinus]|uniref:Beta-ketoacyl-ACP reductase n=1 Tax=Dictyobacter alpinus TaxID=2014873 RepID=A0A402BJQ7_9CHLR|nr:SDR family oxidoreductase [Dictyobacter alpinus]GCE31588.1 beta-ketoacyl-ACP reductase [Dictyobacter alpinus]